jgi:chromosomal replication initiation ATPase DnaA
MFRPVLEEVLSDDFGTPLAVELQSRESLPFDVLEVSPQHPVVDDANSTAHLVLKSLSDGRRLPANLFYFYGPSGVGKTFLLRWWRERSTPRPLWFELMDLLKAFQAAHYERRVDGLRDELVQDKPLVIDELHRVAGKPKLQQFLIQVLRAREALAESYAVGVAVAAQGRTDLDPTLQTLCLAGFVAGIDRPDRARGCGSCARSTARRRATGARRSSSRSRSSASAAIQSCARRGPVRAAHRCLPGISS